MAQLKSVDDHLSQVITQYRESHNLLGLIRIYLQEVKNAQNALCEIPDFFDIDTATGDQLTILGKVLGFPRAQCKGQKVSKFGFSSQTTIYSNRSIPVAGFSEGYWQGSKSRNYGSYILDSDDLYRSFLKSRIISLDNRVEREWLAIATQELWGGNAGVLDSGVGYVSVFTGRLLTNEEISISHLYEEVLPISLGVKLKIYESEGLPFGFGCGWGGFGNGYFSTRIN